MKVSDYIVEYLINRGITDVFGYPGGMVTHLMDSLYKYQDKVNAHIAYHEQGAAFAACGYAQAGGKTGVAYATSGPGATNLITGICHAYFDSVPVVFITGQVNTFEGKGVYQMRQRGFQETDIVSMVVPVTKFAARVENAEKIKWYLDRAFFMAEHARKGPVLLDIPMDVFRAEIEAGGLAGVREEEMSDVTPYMPEEKIAGIFKEALAEAKKPVFLLGNGIKSADAVPDCRKMIEELRIPAVSSMLAVDILGASEYGYGFIGAYGDRSANFVVAKSDLVIALGARCDVRQVGAKREDFAPDAKLIRVDIDEGELEYRVHEDEIHILADVKTVIAIMQNMIADGWDCGAYSSWNAICREMKRTLSGLDERMPNRLMRCIGETVPPDAVVTTDVGQNQVWVAQSFPVKRGQKILFSGGHGAMGYSLPAAVGSCCAVKKPVYSFSGDGGFQMNMQELTAVAKERLPIKIVLFNNHALGMIRHFQEMYFESRYYQTVPNGGYDTPDFKLLVEAYGIRYRQVSCETDIREMDQGVWTDGEPLFVEVLIGEPTYVFPKLEFGKPNQDQEPLLDRARYRYLMGLEPKDEP